MPNDTAAQRSHRIAFAGDPLPAATVRASIDFSSVLEQVPQLVCLVQGPQHTIVFANAALRRAVAEANLVGNPLSASPLAAWPDILDTVDRVSGEGNPVFLRRVPVRLRFAQTSAIEMRLLDVTCQAIRDPLGGIASVMLSGFHVTEQARSDGLGPGSHDHAETILSVVGDGFVSFDSDFRVIRINEAALRFDGRQEQDIVGKTHWEAWPTSKGSFLEETYRRCLTERVEVIVERRYTGFGKDRWLELRLCPVPDGIVSFYRDVTERKLAEEAVRASEERFRALVEAAPHQVWEAGPDGQVEWFNGRFCEYTGITLDELRTNGWGDLIEPGDQVRVKEAWRRALDDGTVFEGEIRLKRESDRSYRWFLSKGVPVRGPDGQVVRWIGTNTDIHDQKIAASRLADVNAELEERVTERTRERDRMWRLSTDLMLLADLAGTIVATNPAWTSMLAWSDEDLLGTPLRALVHPEDADELESVVERLSQDQATDGFETRLRHANGSFRWIAWTAVPDAHFIHAVGRDVTVEREATRALLETEEALRQSQKMEAVGQLTGGIAHDFNNLLTGIMAALDLIQSRIAQGRTRDISRFAEAALASTARAASLTHRLLAFSRRQPLDPKPVDANALISSMDELLRRSTPEGVTVERRSAEGLWLTLCDFNQLENALLNLVINARDAIANEGTITIETRNTELDAAYAAAHVEVAPGDYVALSVRDNGSGMAKDVLDRVFEPFFTTKPMGQGTGLGLSMTYGFVRQSGGHLSISSEVGAGTTVTIYLPRHHGSEGPASEPASARIDSPARANETVLVVEDDPVVRDLVVEMLQELGYGVLEASDGAEGLRILQSKQPIALLLTDVGLPGLNGRQLADAAREHRPNLKVLFMTGYVENTLLDKGFLGQDMEVITKPFAFDNLAAKIAAIMPKT